MSWERKQVGVEWVSFEVPEIVGKQRPRSTHAGGAFRTYTPRKTLEAEEAIRGAWLKQVGDCWAGFEGTVELQVLFQRQLAKSNPKFWAGRSDTGKPDVDNALKTTLDALNGLAFKDDQQVTRIEAIKDERKPHGWGNRITVVARYYQETYRKGQP
ncbi:MAG: RusA family crossover junction endodeoxyribonuclease [Coriobacteriaceae bacterium]|uniref:RusA family crossover junction endodeoxyribonuclease n=1 Tax=Tractidigestivibacter sp. TaxID=2847320 RepID=UPI002A7F47F6|nr:RusA family crossover junction endodeoxyribonuclease [Tractidigestivibacter sp.]MCI6274400.1 RusA family crossover junction endodeoxyribonuclease [Coriobacteriaceae bacterium]MCI6548085.1 RusA family crossover junction endodeoxyribonuclease [Coriobacteriaceae bacterium]MCI6844463.1 RusA family crossover junction endodeoxyribonuclease [Coriobacteriaceae bacterium]MDY4535458.1 RusA family crossover junction endodeoxyribonuclease [Tractidigestivibacter sp.]MDY5272157.1 RusA family crossover ju